MKHFVIIVGTRPEIVKMAPVVTALRRQEPCCRVTLISTGQHIELIDQMNSVFQLRFDKMLQLMTSQQTLTQFIHKALFAIDQELRELQRDTQISTVIVHGDTPTAYAGALAAFFLGIPITHVEAGLRTFDVHNPFPEEFIRKSIDHIATILFPPTNEARSNLISENAAAATCLVTGNTVVDALQIVTSQGMLENIQIPYVDNYALITLHRRESLGLPLASTLAGIERAAINHPDYLFVFPVHPNPSIQEPVHRILGHLSNARLISPVEYPMMLALIRSAKFIVTDSGGIQEEAPSFGTPVLVARKTTERPEGVSSGVARLVGTETDQVFQNIDELISNPSALNAMRNARNPYGDGHAAERIVEALLS